MLLSCCFSRFGARPLPSALPPAVRCPTRLDRHALRDRSAHQLARSTLPGEEHCLPPTRLQSTAPR
jgi:hypothetical protein